jgi:predicted O-linked N-acetylglucosamine transferase (SPINDLY family)
MDFILGDPHMSLQSERHHFIEKVWSLAETWFCLTPPSQPIQISTLPALTNDYVTFGCFGNLSKMNDQVVKTWSKILQRVPNSKLFLKSEQLVDPKMSNAVQRRFISQDISADRLILEGPSSRTAYYEAHNRIDMVLDTFPYPGGTTSVDALWMGVPVLTLKGDRFLSHLGESIATNAGQTNWIAQDSDDYINKAISFVSDIQSLAALRGSLRDQVLRTPLFDSQRFARNFGDALWGMYASVGFPDK